MATLERIRKNGILIAVIIGLALLAFILGDFLTGKSSFFTGSQTEVGEISGKSISIQVLEEKAKELEAIEKLKSRTGNLDEATSERIRQQAWQEVIYENVLKKEFDRLGLTVSSDELYDLFSGPNPHQIIHQVFVNEKGEFDRNLLSQFLKGTNENQATEQMAFRLYIENEISKDRINNKYFNLIRKGLTIPTFLAKNGYTESNKKVDLQYVVQRFAGVSDSSISVTSSDIKKYYNSHKYLYNNQTASRDFDYVSFEVIPSKEDTAIAKEWITKVKPDFENITDVEAFVNGNSDESYIDKNYTVSELPDSLKNMFNSKEGDVYGPYLDNGAFKLARLYKIINIPDSVKARHILITPKANTQEAVDKAKAAADSLKNLVEKGADFAALAKQYSEDKSNADKGGDLGWFTEGKMVKPFNDSAFNAKKGAVKQVATQFGFHILQVQERGKDAKKVKVAIVARKIGAGKQTYDRAYAAAMKFASENRTYAQFNNAVAKQDLHKKMATVGENDKTIPGLAGEKPRTLIDWVYNAEKHNVSEPIVIGDHNIVAVVTAIREKGTAPLEQVKTEVTIAVQKEKKGEKLVEKINKAKSGVSTIQDLSLKLQAPMEMANDISFSSYALQNDHEPKLIACATSYPKNKLSQPIIGSNGVYVFYNTNIIEPPVTKDYSMIREQLTGSLQGEASYGTYNALIKLADITDHRRKFGY